MTNDQGGAPPASRRAVLHAAGRIAVLAPAAAAVAAATSRGARAQQKLAQQMVMYQDQPKDGQRCDACIHWQPPNACAIVEGRIAPEGWCGAFAPKQG